MYGPGVTRLEEKDLPCPWEDTTRWTFDVWVVVAQVVARFAAIGAENPADILEHMNDLEAQLSPESNVVKLAVFILCEIRNCPWSWDHLFPLVVDLKESP